jgi:hypothetical protein
MSSSAPKSAHAQEPGDGAAFALPAGGRFSVIS